MGTAATAAATRAEGEIKTGKGGQQLVRWGGEWGPSLFTAYTANACPVAACAASPVRSLATSAAASSVPFPPHPRHCNCHSPHTWAPSLVLHSSWEKERTWGLHQEGGRWRLPEDWAARPESANGVVHHTVSGYFAALGVQRDRCMLHARHRTGTYRTGNRTAAFFYYFRFAFYY